MKLENLRKHFSAMHILYEHFIKAVMVLVKNPQGEILVCAKEFRQWLACMEYADLRFALYKFVKYVFGSKKEFRRYMDVLGEVFVKVGAKEVPSDRCL